MFFVWILRRHADGIEIEGVIVGFCEPKNGFMSSGKPPLAVKAVTKRPDDPITKLESVMLEKRIENNV